MLTTRLNDLGKTLLVGSGAIGTMLRQGPGPGVPFVEALNLTAPEVVRGLHRSYRAAGSQVLVTNTFAANPILLEEAGLAADCAAINASGVALAREAADGPCLVWASVGPLSLGLRGEDFAPERLTHAYAEQCRALREADAILLETFTDVREAAAALTAAAQTGLPFVFQAGNTGRGENGWRRLDALVDIAIQAGACAVGANCRHPREIVDVARHLLGRTALPVTVAANAGAPAIARGRVLYEFPPAAFREVSESLWELGVSLVGGCCGTTPEHVAAVAAVLHGKAVRPRGPAVETLRPAARSATAQAEQDNPVRRLIRSERLVISVEIRAERTSGLDAIVRGAEQVAAAGADLFDVPDKPGATVGRDAAVAAARLQEVTGIPSIGHRAALHANLLEAHSALIGCWDLGLKGVLAVTGDPPSIGPLGSMATRVADLKSSVELLRLIRTLRAGATVTGDPIDDPPDLCAGCTVGRSTPAHLEWLRKKIEAGAEFVFSQPVFDADSWRRLRDDVGRFGVRLFPGVMPVVSRKSAQSLAGGRIPGIHVPESFVAEFDRFESREDQRKFGLDCALRLARLVAAEGRALYLIMPFGRTCYEDAAALVRAVRS